jgi:hypothetical protein
VAQHAATQYNVLQRGATQYSMLEHSMPRATFYAMPHVMLQ